MKTEFQEVARFGFMKHNGGFQFREVSKSEFEYKTTIQDMHLNSGGITHGGYIMSLMDSGLGTAVYRTLDPNDRAATISLDVKFIAASNVGDTLIGSAKILKKTRSLVFVSGELRRGQTLVATADGIWKIL
ncbi:MAG: PaaI family thioesterase [Desulforhopalus sp.]